MCDDDACMVRLRKETLCNNGQKIRHSLATLNFNNFVVYGQKHKVWVLIFLEQAEHFETPKLSRLGEIFCFASKKHRLQQLHSRTLLSMSSNGLGNKAVISCLFVV